MCDLKQVNQLYTAPIHETVNVTLEYNQTMHTVNQTKAWYGIKESLIKIVKIWLNTQPSKTRVTIIYI